MYFSKANWFRRAVALATLAAATPLVLAQAALPTPEPAASAATPEESSYSIGLVFGNQLHSAGVDESLSLEAMMRGFKDGLGGKSMSPEDRQRAMQMVRAGRERITERNHVAAREFLAKNATAPGITTTNSGLQYEVIAAGVAQGASPALTDRVTVHYRGRLLDGTEFDNSDAHAQAATFSVNGILKGWREALLLMKTGAKWRLFIPPELAYDMNSPPNIPPGSLLIFDVELVKIEAPAVMGGPVAKPAAAN